MRAIHKTILIFILATAITLPIIAQPVLALGEPLPEDESEGGFKWDPWGWAKEHILKPLTGAFNWLIDQIKGVIESVFGGIADSIKSFFSSLGMGLWDAIQAPFNTLKSAWASIEGFINWLPPWAKPFAPLVIIGVVAAAGYILWWLIRSIVPGI